MLPREVYDCIIAQLEQIYMLQHGTYQQCYLKDLHSLALTSRAWDKAATVRLYRRIVIFLDDEQTDLSNVNTKAIPRLRLLRRTLRENPALARTVRELDASRMFTFYETSSIEREDIVDQVASLIMAVPSLERLIGFNLPYTNTFNRLTHALSTRRKLKERLWIIEDPTEKREQHGNGELIEYYHEAHDPTERFLDLNSRHPLLATLVIHLEEERAPKWLNYRAIMGTIRQCENLQHLAIIGLAANTFTDLALISLPSNLQSLRLESLSGLTEKGLQRFSRSETSTSLKSLTLINLDVRSLNTISDIFSAHYPHLEVFSIVQDRAPDLGQQSRVPGFVSTKLRRLHWEFRAEAGPLSVPHSSHATETPETLSFPFINGEPICCLATSLLASSIENGGFPALRRVRIPHDPQGVIQALCKPLAMVLLPRDTIMQASSARMSSSENYSVASDLQRPTGAKVCRFSALAISPDARTDSVMCSPTDRGGFSQSELTPMRSRLAAQARISATGQAVGMALKVLDPEGNLQFETVIGGYLGHASSRIVYDLSTDQGQDSDHWVTNVYDVISGCSIEAATARGTGVESSEHGLGVAPRTIAVMDDLF
ncbi:hypothetical protein ACN47E_005705 [Coniothyrium glycines]